MNAVVPFSRGVLRACLLAVWLTFGAHCASAAPSELLLATGGQATMPIVLSPHASAATKAVANELAEYLKRITDAPFEVQTGDGKSGIVLGTLAEFPNPTLDKPLEIRNGYDGKEAFAIRTEPKRVLLIGATDLGASHAAYRFLERLGCRWFFPAKEWQVVPRQSTLRVSVEDADRPVFLSRRIWYAYGIFTEVKNYHRADAHAKADYENWARHNLMAASFLISTGHAWDAIVRSNKAAFDAHPEYWALIEGQRKPGAKLELGNPAVRKMIVDYALNFFKKYPDRDMVSIEPSDGGGWSESPESKALGTVSDQLFGMANEVARALQKEFPGKMVGLLAYNYHTDPPSFDLEPNVYVQRATSFVHSQYSSQERMKLWAQRAKRIGFYDYFSVWLWDYDMPPGGRANNMEYLRTRIPEYARYGATSLDAESSNNWGLHGRGYYIANKLMWNPNADVDALLADFYGKAFGPAASAMKRYYERLDAGGAPSEMRTDQDDKATSGFNSENLLAQAFRDVQEASTLAKDLPDVQARLDQIKWYLRYVQLRWEMERASDAATKKALTLSILTQVFRTRYAYMNHWAAIYYSWKSRVMKEFNEPSWSAADPSPKPWVKNDTPPSHEETEAMFQEGLKRFIVEKVVQQEYSPELAAVQFSGATMGETYFSYQGPATHALFSARGEPLECEITVAQRAKPPATYALCDSSGNEITTGTVAPDGNVHRLQFTVPHVGTYLLSFNDNNASWTVRGAAEKAFAIALQRNQLLNRHGAKPLYFYVPRGTRELIYFWAGGAHDVCGPDGQLVRHVTQSGAFIHVPVTPGADGKVWSFRKMMLRNLWFFNAPNLLAASPGILLVPRDLAAKDGLLTVP
jgi:hypothetical protein